MTPRGRQAYALLSWIYEDVSGRAQDGFRQINDLARQAEPGSQELREIQDAGTMASRLADTGDTMPADSISGQLQ